ncbi:MAG: cytochrome c3 family protein, partial [Planctomycetota bacterium]
IAKIMKLFKKYQKFILGFMIGILFSVLSFLTINTVSKPFSSPEYCGSNCHEMRSAYSSWELSAHHANSKGVVVECIDCHLPPKDKFFSHMTSKSFAGLKDTIKHHFGGEYDSKKMQSKVQKEMPNSRCLKCHSGLLVKATSASRIAHQVVLNSGQEEHRCVKCHSQLHERTKTLYSN